MESPDPKPRLRPRISLLSLLLLTALVACGLVITLQARELGPLRREVQQLRDEVGSLVILDDSVPHALKIDIPDTATRKEWRWRIWCPPGTSPTFHYYEGPTGGKGWPPFRRHDPWGMGENNGSAQLRGGVQYTVSYTFEHDAATQRWSSAVRLTSADGSGPISFGSTSRSEIPWMGGVVLVEGVQQQTTQLSVASKRALVYRLRGMPGVNSSAGVPSVAPGFMLWLEF